MGGGGDKPGAKQYSVLEQDGAFVAPYEMAAPCARAALSCIPLCPVADIWRTRVRKEQDCARAFDPTWGFLKVAL